MRSNDYIDTSKECTVMLENAYGDQYIPTKGTHSVCVKWIEDNIQLVDGYVGNKDCEGVHILYASGRCASYILFK